MPSYVRAGIRKCARIRALSYDNLCSYENKMKQKEPTPPPPIRFFVPSHGDNALKPDIQRFVNDCKIKNTC